MNQPSPVDEETAKKLIAAVETALNPSPSVTPADRFNANHYCNQFKETCANCAPYGLFLARKENSFPVRHGGLQLFEHSIKHQWNDIGPGEKLFVKNSAMTLLASGTHDLLREPTHIKDALSRLIVEMIKREWPQHWPLMLAEMNQLAALGETQMELVLFIFLRLAEDVVTFQNVPNQRRRDIQQALVQNMDAVFSFLVDALRNAVQRYLKSRSEDPESDASKANCKVASTALIALGGFVDWVNVDHLVKNDAILIKMLCELLSDPLLRQEAVEVLLLVVGRKGKLAERSPIVAFVFRADSMRAVLGAATVTAEPTDEKSFLFLKRLCQVLTAIGSQIHALWGSPEVDIAMPPANFDVFLSALVEFSLHDAQVLNNLTMSLWANFLGNEFVTQDANFQTRVKRLLKDLPVKLIKVGYPSANVAASSSYARADFDSDDDFYNFFVKFRADVSMVFRLATNFYAPELIDIAGTWLLDLLTEVGAGKTADPLQWDACAILLECVMKGCDLEDAGHRSKGLSMMTELLKVNSGDPVIFSYMLSCVSALFECLTFGSVEDPTFLSALQRIFSAVMFNVPGQNKATRSKACKNLRRHACSSLVTICKKHASFLLPKFEELCKFITDLDKSASLSQMEKVTLYEALVLISNKFEDLGKQRAFLETILAPIGDIWQSEELRKALDQTNAPLNFMTHVGLDQPALEPSVDDLCGINRSNLILCLNMIKGVVSRTAILNVAALDADQLAAAKRRGFVVDCPSLPRGVVATNPATPHVSKYLKNLFLLLKTQNAMWTPVALSKIHPHYSKTLNLSDADKRQFVGIIAETKSLAAEIPLHEPFSCPKNPQDRLQQFFQNIYDTTCQVLGSCGYSLGPQYYWLDGFSSFIVENVFHNFDNTPDHRVRMLNRTFFKPFFENLPEGPSGVNVAIPILNALCPAMCQRLTTKWEKINNQEVSAEGQDDPRDATNDEVVEEAISRVLTREYYELLLSICLVKSASLHRSGDATMEEDGMADAGSAKQQNDASLVSDVGKAVCKMELLCTSILRLAFKALSWKDTSTCNKCITLCLPLLKEVITNCGGALPPEVAGEFLTDILRGLRENGQHDAIQSNLVSLGAQFYDILAPNHRQSLTSILVQIPGINLKMVDGFHNKFFPSEGKPTPEKKKRDLFKNLVMNVIGKPVGQQFKDDVRIKNLPPIFKPKQLKTPLILSEVSSDEIGLVGLFSPID